MRQSIQEKVCNDVADMIYYENHFINSSLFLQSLLLFR